MLLPVDNHDEELFIETRDDWARLGHFQEEKLRNFEEEDKEMRS